MNTLTPSPAAVQLSPIDALLLRHFARICEALDIPPSRWERAKQAYETLGRILTDPMNPLARFKPSVYPQGSARLQTTIRPVRGDEFDIDLICELLAMQGHPVEAIFAAVQAAIEGQKVYAGKVSIHNRCVRITFAGDFHLDITPGVPDRRHGPENILITDRPSRSLKDSNPKDYCDQWFQRIAAVPPRIRSVPPRTSGLEAMLENRADVESVKDPKAMRAILIRIIQLFKRHRDITWSESKDAPISAIITTTTAWAYAELCLREFDSPYDLILAIAEALPSKLGPQVLTNGVFVHTCLNPANPRENFADKWPRKPQRQEAFFRWQKSLVAYLRDLRNSSGQGTDVLQRKLAAGFGRDLVDRLALDEAKDLKQKAAAGAVGITTAGLILSRKSAVIEIRPQTFHGGALR